MLFGTKSRHAPEATHRTLGTLSYDRDSASWGKRIKVIDQDLRLSVGGESEPDPTLLEQAAILEARLPVLIGNLATFLERDAARAPEFESEIRSLKVDDVAVWWPKEPEAVMIWFKGPSQERIWHCGYTNGELSDLVYDC
jgi:hypothetical protein